MGASLSLNAPQFGSGLVTFTAGAVSLSTFFLATTTDTKNLGFTATVDYTYHSSQTSDIGDLSITYTDTSSSVHTALCDVSTASTSAATLLAETVTLTYGSVQCPVPNTAIGTGTVYLIYSNVPETTFAFYAGEYTATTDGGITSATVAVPGATVFATTDVSTTYESTITTTKTVTLTGALPTSLCTSTSVSAPTTTSTLHSATTSSTRNPCTTGNVYKALTNHPAIAPRFCSDLLAEKHHQFPSSISVWPATRVSSACSCYETYGHANTKRGVGVGYGPLTPYPVTKTITTYDSTAISTESTTVSMSDSISYVDAGTSTADAGTTVTVDQRTCAASSTTVLPDKRSSSFSTCSSLELQIAYLDVELGHPIDFCKFYLAAEQTDKPNTFRSRSPLTGVDAQVLADTCTCVVNDRGAKVPAKGADRTPPAVGRFACDQTYASTIKMLFKQHKLFCAYWNSFSGRSRSPILGLTARNISAGCQCSM